jgi:hypothetical protein
MLGLNQSAHAEYSIGNLPQQLNRLIRPRDPGRGGGPVESRHVQALDDQTIAAALWGEGFRENAAKSRSIVRGQEESIDQERSCKIGGECLADGDPRTDRARRAAHTRRHFSVRLRRIDRRRIRVATRGQDQGGSKQQDQPPQPWPAEGGGLNEGGNGARSIRCEGGSVYRLA